MKTALDITEAEVIDQFRSALENRDIVPPHSLAADGKLHRCDAVGRGGKGDAAYILHLDGLPAGGFENHRDGIGWENWRANIGRLLTPKEQEEGQRRVEAARIEREADDTRRKAEASTRAKAIWQEGEEDCIGHPYLTRKGVQAHGVRRRAAKSSCRCAMRTAGCIASNSSTRKAAKSTSQAAG